MGGTRMEADYVFVDYLQGHVDGPVVWDRLNVGGYEVENQAIGMLVFCHSRSARF